MTAIRAIPDCAEIQLVQRVLAALLREDVLGLRTRSSTVLQPDGRWLRLPAPENSELGALLLPVCADGFQCDYTARRAVLIRESDGHELDSLTEVVSALTACADPVDTGGFDAFAEECDDALATMRLHRATRGRISALLIAYFGADLSTWTGYGAALAFDTMAARGDHPVYPTARARWGLTDLELRAYAPEFHPRFALRWLAVPRAAITLAGGNDLPGYWPAPADLGLRDLADTHLLLPVHPLSVGAPLRAALAALDLADDCVLAARPYLEVIPTLSMRTVALADDPAEHLKLPLATATLGLRNVRTIMPRTLVDGALGQRLLGTVLAREPRFRDTILLADENSYAHAAHELLAVLCRRYPAGLDEAVVVPMAALTCRAHDGRLILDHLADRFYGGEAIAMFDAWTTLLFDWQTTLFGYGIALESHQQNISLVLDHVVATDTNGAAADQPMVPRLRLLLKDNDVPRIHTDRLRQRLGAVPADFADPRVNVDDDGPLTDLFTTITVHLCTGTFAFELSALGYGSLPALLTLLRDRLDTAIRRLDPPLADRLRADVLDAPALPVKAMVSAGTLFGKERFGATDINKHYTSGPNYLAELGGSR